MKQTYNHKNYDAPNRLINYYKPGTLNIIAGRPAMGKTTFSVKLAKALKQPIAYFSLEKTEEELIKTKGFNNDDGLIHIDDTPQLIAGDLEEKSRKLKEVYSIQMIIVDYLQLLSSDVPTNTNISRAEELKIIAKGLKSIATKLQVPVVATSQLSRSEEKRTSHRPMLCDFREGAGMLDYVDDVRLLYRPAYYGIFDSSYENTINVMEIIPTEKNYGENNVFFDKQQ